MEFTLQAIALGCWLGIGWAIGSGAATCVIRFLASVRFVWLRAPIPSQWFIRRGFVIGRLFVLRLGRLDIAV